LRFYKPIEVRIDLISSFVQFERAVSDRLQPLPHELVSKFVRFGAVT